MPKKMSDKLLDAAAEVRSDYANDYGFNLDRPYKASMKNDARYMRKEDSGNTRMLQKTYSQYGLNVANDEADRAAWKSAARKSRMRSATRKKTKSGRNRSR